MTKIDLLLQNWRIKKAIAYIPDQARLLDIGCFKGELMLKAGKVIVEGIGIDPLCEPGKPAPHIKLLTGMFPDALPERKTFNCITALAVLEHIPAPVQPTFMLQCYQHLEKNGRLIITVPDPKVDKILDVLTKLRLVKGMSLEEHFGFDSASTPQLGINAGFKLLTHQTFQLGLNNLFVFIKA